MIFIAPDSVFYRPLGHFARGVLSFFGEVVGRIPRDA